MWASSRSAIPLVGGLAFLACAGLYSACSLNPQPTPPRDESPVAGPATPPGGVASETTGGVPGGVDGDSMTDDGTTDGGGPASVPEGPGAASGGSGSGVRDPNSAAGTAGAAGEGGAPGIVH